jgi:hypothetical protein
MTINLIPERKLADLFESITGNLSIYRTGGSFDIDDVIKLELNITLPKLTGDDRENAVAIYAALKDLPLSVIRDKRFWTHLTHVEYLDYTRERWPVENMDDEKAARRIKTRYFAEDDRAIESRSAISRLYWTGFACSRYPGSFEQAIDVVTYNETIHADMIERPTIIEVPAVFNGMTRRLIDSLASDKLLFNRSLFREIAKEVNLACGSVFIESFSDDQVQEIIDGIIEKAISEHNEEANVSPLNP